MAQAGAAAQRIARRAVRDMVVWGEYLKSQPEDLVVPRDSQPVQPGRLRGEAVVRL